MHSLAIYLDELKQRSGNTTDAELSVVLGVSRQHISQIRSGSHMGEEKCFELAWMVGREPLELLSLNRAIRSKGAQVRRYWLKIHETEKRKRSGDH